MSARNAVGQDVRAESVSVAAAPTAVATGASEAVISRLGPLVEAEDGFLVGQTHCTSDPSPPAVLDGAVVSGPKPQRPVRA